MKRTAALLLGCALCAGCSTPLDPDVSAAAELGSSAAVSDRGAFEDAEIFSNECSITLGETILIHGGGAFVEGKEISISEGGVYEISGELEGGGIWVDSADPVKLILNGASIRSGGAAIFSEGGKLIVESAEGTENFLSGDLGGGDEPSAALCAAKPLALCGRGTLSVDGGSGNGIVGRESLEIQDCALTVTAKKNGLRTDGAFTLTGASLTILSKKGKGIKAGSFSAAECDVRITAEDDAVRVSGEAVIDGGQFDFSSASGKGLSADGNLTVNDGTVTVRQSTEGLECKAVLTVNGGYLGITSSDDGLNAGGKDGGQAIVINGGGAFINAEGDGLDSNGDIVMTGGTFVIFGPTHDGDGALDCGEGHKITVSGGMLLALGNAAMAQTPEKNYLFERIDARAGNVVSVLTEDGEPLLAIPIPKDAQTAVYADGSDPAGLRIEVDQTDVLPS